MRSPDDNDAPRVRVPRPYTRRRRTRRIVAAVLVGAVATGAAVVTSIVVEHFIGSDSVMVAAVVGFFAGSAAAGSAVLMMPAIRVASGRSLEARLLAAASPAHPLLRALMLNAPGTYAHSVAVANLAETAADEIGANALLTRVGAYYHDVGKIENPDWFFENLRTGVNPHDQATPEESVNIITAHVRNGEHLVREYQVPHEIESIVRQHHGTSLVRYFYHKATTQHAGVYEADFRYQAEKPTTREAALVMLADACEAAVRASQNKANLRADKVVDAVFSEKIEDGQLEESGLTPQELSRVKEIFVDMLSSMYHSRLEYPEMPSKEVVDADQHSEQARS